MNKYETKKNGGEKMKKIIFSLGFVLVSGCFLLLAPNGASAAAKTWDLTGSYTLDFTCVSGCSGVYSHTMNVTDENLFKGTFTGNGHYNTDASYTWNLNGSVDNNDVKFNIVYTGSNSGYKVDATGSISKKGILSGTASSSDGQTFTWITSSGKAKKVNVTLKWRQKLQSENCDAVGKPIINVVQKVIGDADSGEGGNYWAFDKYLRHIQVWNTPASGTYCAIVVYNGSYTTIPGQKSPGNTGVISKKSGGSMNGGRIATIKGDLLDPTAWPKKGMVGSYDYGCDENGVCPGVFKWADRYFQSGYTNTDTWWGWIYRGGHHGMWINSADGNFGDIK